MGTSDVQKVFLETKSRGLNINEPIYGARHSADGDMEYSWRQSEIEPSEFPGSQTFFIQHDHSIKQRYKDPPNAWKHENGSLGIYNLTLVVDDAMEAIERDNPELRNVLPKNGGYRKSHNKIQENWKEIS